MTKHRPLHKRIRGAPLGQHLLTNSGIAHAVAQSARIEKGDRVLEIGPGTGMLTKEILALGGKVSAVEKDSTMIAVLKEKLADDIERGNLKLIEGDARTVTPDIVFPKEKYKVAANIPYYITGELLRLCLGAKNQPEIISLLVQKEVAERIVGRTSARGGHASGGKENILSLSVKVFGTPRYVKTVSRGSFNPPPSVDSAILTIENISRKNFENVTEKKFFEIVKTGFAQKRKTLGGNLKKMFGERAHGALAESGISEKTRAEDVPLKGWLDLARKL